MQDEPVKVSVYDGDGVAARYTQHRNGNGSANEVMEGPAFADVVGEVESLAIVDLGCGNASFGRVALEAGCRSYLGFDSSIAMLSQARATLAGTQGKVRLSAIEDVELPAGSVDLLVSRLSLHYVDDLEPLLASCRRWLSPAGRLVVTVLHPVLTSPRSSRQATERRTDWTVDDYFSSGPRQREWMGSTVTWYHRTIEQYLQALTSAGLALSSLRECEPRPEQFLGPGDPELARRRRVPMFLLLAAYRADAEAPPNR